MVPLNDETKLQVDENNKKNLKKKEKSLESTKMYNIIYFKTIRYKLTIRRLLRVTLYDQASPPS